MGCLDSTKTQIRIFWKRRAFVPVLSFKKLYFETTLLFKLASLEITIMISLMWSTCDTGITLVDIGTVFIRLSSNIKWDFSIAKIIAESVYLIQMSKQNRKVLSPWWRTINFLSKNTTYQNTGWGKKNVFVIFVMYCNKFQFAWQKPYSRQSQTPYSTWRKLT